MYPHCHGVDLVSVTIRVQSSSFGTLCRKTAIKTLLLDLKLVTNEDNREGINVTSELYEQACITDAKKGIEVSRSRCCSSDAHYTLRTRLPVKLAFRS